jgi:hypothetical protein
LLTDVFFVVLLDRWLYGFVGGLEGADVAGGSGFVLVLVSEAVGFGFVSFSLALGLL